MKEVRVAAIQRIIVLLEIHRAKQWDDFLAFCVDQEHCNHE